MLGSKEAEQPPPYHDWTVVPDTARLLPPPSISFHASPVANASSDDADRAHAWTEVNPLWPTAQLSPSGLQALSIGLSSLIQPAECLGITKPDRSKAGLWNVETKKKCGDCCFLSTVPLFSAAHSQHGNDSCTAYYEVKVEEISAHAGLAIGFIAPPYPTWRLPGWERASLGVHGDDGRRFVNDTWGGKDFTSPFSHGDVVGIGMTFKPPQSPPNYYEKNVPLSRPDVEVFFTRNGAKEAFWNLHEETDAEFNQPGGVTGLAGNRDLHAAIGAYGATTFSVIFGRHNWMYHP